MESGKPQHVSKEHEKFMKEFIQLYRENQLLWDKSHPKYKSRVARNAAFDVIINKCQEYYPEANIDFVKHKIEGMRTAFRREHKKVLESKKLATEDNYVPTLWYYNHFLFIVGEECNENLETTEASSRSMYFWSKKHTVSLIELLKKYPILSTMDAGSNTAKVPRIKAYNELTKELIADTDKHFDVEEVRKKISSLKAQYRRECKNKSNGGPHTLWCYELLTFLKDYRIKKDIEKDDDNDVSDDSRDNVGKNCSRSWFRLIPDGNAEEVKFLGVCLDPVLVFGKHIDYMTTKLSRHIFLLRNLSRIVPAAVLLQTFHAMFLSVAFYAILVWGHAPQFVRVFALQRRAVRIIAGLGYRDEIIKDNDPYGDIDNKDEKMLMDENYDDIFDTIGKNVAVKLRDMSDDQRKYAEDLVNQVMYNGLMENLNADSTLTLNSI